MQSEDSRQKKRPERSAFVPMTLMVITLLIMASFQTGQLYREKENLISIKLNQKKPLEESRKVRTQFDSIATDTAKLAAQGNENAQLLLIQLEKMGVSVSPPAQSTLEQEYSTQQ